MTTLTWLNSAACVETKERSSLVTLDTDSHNQLVQLNVELLIGPLCQCVLSVSVSLVVSVSLPTPSSSPPSRGPKTGVAGVSSPDESFL